MGRCELFEGNFSNFQINVNFIWNWNSIKTNFQNFWGWIPRPLLSWGVFHTPKTPRKLGLLGLAVIFGGDCPIAFGGMSTPECLNYCTWKSNKLWNFVNGHFFLIFSRNHSLKFDRVPMKHPILYFSFWRLHFLFV